MDVIIVFILNILLTIAISWKPDNFFEEVDGDFTLNKKVDADGDDYSKDPLEAGFDESDFKKSFIHGDSYSALNANMIEEESSGAFSDNTDIEQ